jgi:outer membrane protein W
MKRTAVVLLAMVITLPLAAQRRVDLLVDVEGVYRQSGIDAGDATAVYSPRFETGGGIGAGVNVWMTGRVSLEFKAAVLASEMELRFIDGDAVTVLDVGFVNMIPLSAVVQWHPFEEGAIRPYFGAGAVYVMMQDVEQREQTPQTNFGGAAGLLLNAGLRVPLSKRFALTADARYVPVETRGTVRFGDDDIEGTAGELDVRPLVVGFGLAYSF